MRTLFVSTTVQTRIDFSAFFHTVCIGIRSIPINSIGSGGGATTTTSKTTTTAMPIRASCWAFVVAFVWTTLASMISAFTTPPRTTMLRPHTHRLPILPMASSSLSNDNDDDQQPSFSMKQDWALIDAVPRYTVNADNNGGRPATFWTQLSVSTPELSLLSPEQLEARYSELLCQSSPNETTNATITRRLPAGGPQPPVLDRWSWSDDGGKVVGVLPDSGSTVWLTVAARGWLADDPTITTTTTATAVSSAEEPKPFPFGGALASVLLPPTTAKENARPPLRDTKGGWVVSLAGVIYELGVPATSTAATTTTTTGGDVAQQPVWISPLVSNLATFALLAAATVGFVAGASFNNQALPSSPSPAGRIIVATQNRAPLPPGSTNEELTIAEQRVLQERRVAGRELQLLRETEAVVRIESKIRVDEALLEKDRAGLEKLKRLEDEKGGGLVVRDLNLGAVLPATPNDLTISEQRAQQERRVAGRELQVVRETEKATQMESKIRVNKALLEKDRAGLEKLKQLENERGGEAVLRGQFLEYK